MRRYRPTQHTDDAAEYFPTRSKKPRGRGMGKKQLALVEAIYKITEAMQPITVRGVGYKLFVRKLIASMSTDDVAAVSRLLKIAREKGTIPWAWIVDPTRQIDKVATWDDPEDYARTVTTAYRRDFWNQQPVRVIVISEKSTVQGLLKPTLDKYGIGFLPVHGFNSATSVHNLCIDYEGRPLIILYVGDYDCSGMCMSVRDLPKRFKKYGGHHITLKRIALTQEHTKNPSLISFPASDKGPKPGSKGDPNYKWFVRNYGDRCWELDAMDPNELRDIVEQEIKALIEPVAWARCEVVYKAEFESLQTILKGWRARPTRRYRPIGSGGGVHRAVRRETEEAK